MPVQANIQNVNKFISIPWYAARGLSILGHTRQLQITSHPICYKETQAHHGTKQHKEEKSAFGIVKPTVSEQLSTQRGASKPTQGPWAAGRARSRLRSRDLAAGPLHTGAA